MAGSLAAADEVSPSMPALIVLDVQLPDGDGLDLARRLKAMPRSAVPDRRLHRRRDAGRRERALAAGCDAYVSKPIDTREFAALVAPSSAPASGARHRRPGPPGTGLSSRRRPRAWRSSRRIPQPAVGLVPSAPCSRRPSGGAGSGTAPRGVRRRRRRRHPRGRSGLGEQRRRADRIRRAARSSIGVRTPCGHRHETLIPASP